MKIRADFVTNSSSSSYCAIRVNTDAGMAVNLSNVECRGFYTFWFHDPTAKLANVKNIRDLLTSIEYSVGGNSSNMDEKWLEKQLSVITDIASVTSVEISCHEEIADRDYSDPWPRDVRYGYNFGTGTKTVWSDTSWRSYRGYGDSLRPDFRSLDGKELPFDFYAYVKGYLVISCRSKAKEIVIPERILEDGEEKVVQGIGAKCFAGMKTLESLVLPRTAAYIAPDAFDGIKKTLKSIRVDGFDASETTFVRDGSKLELTVSPEKELAIPDDVTELGESAFGGCLNLRTIRLHDGMKKPSMTALQSCSGLTYVVLTDGSKISIAKKDAMRCFTISRGVIGYDYEKCEGYGIMQPGRSKASIEEQEKGGKRSRSPRKPSSNPWTVAAIKKAWKYRGKSSIALSEFRRDDCVAIAPNNVGSTRVWSIWISNPSMMLRHVIVPDTVEVTGVYHYGTGGIVIHALPGSKAEKWAKRNAIFEPLEYDPEVEGAYIEAAEARKSELDALLAKGNLAEQAKRFGKVWFAKMWWNVVKQCDGKALLVADGPIRSLDLAIVRANPMTGAVEEIPFNKQGSLSMSKSMKAAPVTWADCSLRAWLNGEFLERASQEELSYVVETKLDNSMAGVIDNSWFKQCIHRKSQAEIAKALKSLVECPDTVDRVFCLSIAELHDLKQGLVSYTRTRNGGIWESSVDLPGVFEYLENNYFAGETLKKAFRIMPSNWGGYVVPAAWISLGKRG